MLADAAISLLAIVALAGGMYWDAPRLDPFIGLAGAVLVGWWALGLLRDSAGVLLDQHGPDHVERKLRHALETGGDRIEDLHGWEIAPGGYAAIVSLRCDAPETAEYYKIKVPKEANILHLTVEVHRRLTGVTILWSDVRNRSRQRCAVTIPRNAMGPQNAVTVPTRRAVIPKAAMRARSTGRPSVRA